MIFTIFPFAEDVIGLKVTRVDNGFDVESIEDLEISAVDGIEALVVTGVIEILEVTGFIESEGFKGKPPVTDFDKHDKNAFELLGLCVNVGSVIPDNSSEGLELQALFYYCRTGTGALDNPSFGELIASGFIVPEKDPAILDLYVVILGLMVLFC